MKEANPISDRKALKDSKQRAAWRTSDLTWVMETRGRTDLRITEEEPANTAEEALALQATGDQMLIRV